MCRTTTSSHYAFPHIYATLLAPTPDEIARLDHWLTTHAHIPPRLAFDPACGPGCWLEVLVQRGIAVAGNELQPEAAAYARTRLAGAEIHTGDMRHLQFSRRDFDLVLNLNSSLGHLRDPDAILEHLRSTRLHLRPGALYLVSTTLSAPGPPDVSLFSYFDSGFQALPAGGRVRLRYDSVERRPEHERMRVTLETQDVPGAPRKLTDLYNLQTPSDTWFASAFESCGFHIEAVYADFLDALEPLDHPRDADTHDVIYALRAV